VEIGLELLQEFIQILWESVVNKKDLTVRCEDAAEVLIALTRCGRFRLHVMLAGVRVAQRAVDVLKRATPSARIHAAIHAYGGIGTVDD
jgi:hypothetical protein